MHQTVNGTAFLEQKFEKMNGELRKRRTTPALSQSEESFQAGSLKEKKERTLDVKDVRLLLVVLSLHGMSTLTCEFTNLVLERE